MRKLISDTARWGELTVGPRIIDRTVQKRMKSALQKIRSGQFAREFIREMKPPRTRYAQLLPGRRKASNRKGGRAIARNDGLARKNVIRVRAATMAARDYRRNRRSFGYCPVRWPKISSAPWVVGIAASRSQGCGMREFPVTV